MPVDDGSGIWLEAVDLHPDGLEVKMTIKPRPS